MKAATFSGATLAMAAAAVILTGTLPPPQAEAASAGKCYGANACKGKSACKTASSECKGHNACKGKGFVMLSKAKCAKIKGATFKGA